MPITDILLHPPSIPPETWLNYEAVLLAAHAPLVIGSIILLAFYWRALLRTRELYADARVVVQQGTAKYLWEQLQLQSAIRGIQSFPVTWWEKVTAWNVRWRTAGSSCSMPLAREVDFARPHAGVQIFFCQMVAKVQYGSEIWFRRCTCGALECY